VNLRRKTILFIVSIMCLSFLASYVTSNLVVLNGFEKLENADVETQMNRATNALNSKITDLTSFLVVGWANWDDTYQFIQDNNTNYITNNLGDQNMRIANLNVIIYINLTGQVTYSEAYNITGESGSQAISELSIIILGSLKLWKFSNIQTSVGGILCISKGIFMISSAPIEKSNGTGPVMGALVMGRELSASQVASLGSQTNLRISLVNYSGGNLSSDVVAAKSNLPYSGSIYIHPVNSSLINGYTLLPDALGNPDVILRVSVPRNIFSQGVATVDTYLVLIALCLVYFGVAAYYLLEKGMISRVGKITTTVSKITSADDVGQRGVLRDDKFSKSNDELSTLTKSINRMLDRIHEITQQLNMSQRLATIGELSVMVAHDLRNPLQGIRFAVDCLKNEKSSTPERRARIIGLIESDVRYSEKIVEDLLGYSGEIRLDLSETDPKTLMSSSLSHMSIPQTVQIEDLTQDTPRIMLDADKICRVFDNLIQNAIEAMPEGGKLTVRSQVNDKTLQILFNDTGRGIAPENLSKLFTPLFTTKAKGMGFGLTNCRRIVEAHNGKISVESTLDVGTTFRIDLPINLQKPIGQVIMNSDKVFSSPLRL
jgi:signal transduction histidine kinase